MSARILYQLQLSAYDTLGRFILSADSNWNIFVQKCVQLVKLDPDIKLDVLVPESRNLLEDPDLILRELGVRKNVSLVPLPIRPSAVITRYDFPWSDVERAFNGRLPSYTHVYVNDPMLLRHYRAMFHLTKLRPKFIVQTHFLDSPLSRIVDMEVSYWHGTVEAALKSDHCLWHSQSMFDQLQRAMKLDFAQNVIDRVVEKSSVWKDSYSSTEIRRPVSRERMRFVPEELVGKTVVWVPNRVGGLGRSLDYTNNGKFLFEIVPELWKSQRDFVVIAGNPNQKISNDELARLCPAYVKLVSGPFNRDEYRWLSQRADIVVGLYTDGDTNGGLASLEAIEFNAVPLFPDVNEYKVYFDNVSWPSDLRVRPDLSDCSNVLSELIDKASKCSEELERDRLKLQEFVRSYASYESNTRPTAEKLGLV